MVPPKTVETLSFLHQLFLFAYKFGITSRHSLGKNIWISERKWLVLRETEPYLFELEFTDVYNNHNRQLKTLDRMGWI